MVEIRNNFDLTSYNTFGIHSRCRTFAELTREEDFETLLEEAGSDVFVLGGGSNLLLPEYFDRFVLCNRIPGRRRIDTEGGETIVELGGGENWHEVVLWAVGQDLGGIENLSLIPGTVGAAPIQNIGAYGVELREVFHSLEAISLATGEKIYLDPEECEFGYRDSIFKREWKEKYLITRVRLRLTHRDHHLETSYGNIREDLEANGIGSPTIRDISDAVIRIRHSKLPDPAELGNSGSFFKNPVIGPEQFKILRQEFDDLKFYPAEKGQYKIPAGWMIDKCGWKGKRIGDVGCYDQQALVIVNHGDATTGDIRHFAREVRQSVFNAFGIWLETEVNILR